MPLFEYLQVNQKGQFVKLQMQADSLQEAQDILVRQGIWYDKLAIKKMKALPVMNLSEKIRFFEELQQLLKANIVLYEAIELMEAKRLKDPLYPIFATLKESLRRGKTFAASMECAGKSFNLLIIGMIRTSESSGDVLGVVCEIVLLLKKEEWLKKQIISSISYPIFLLTLAFVVLGVLLCFLVPSLKDLFSIDNLPVITRGIIFTSDFICEHAVKLLLSLITTAVLFAFFLRQKSVHSRLQNGMLQLPYLATFLKEYYMARFSRTLYALVIAKVPLVQALEMTLHVMRHPLFQKSIEQALVAIHQGKSITAAFDGVALIPKMFCRMLDTAEKSGQIASTLSQASEMYETSVEIYLKRLLAILQPALIIIIGLIVGLIMIGTLLPMTDIRSFMEA
jgi:general secretion pathway protein F